MAFTLKRRQTNLPSFYRSRTNAEQLQFISAAAGDAYIFENTADAAERTFRGITASGVNQIDLLLPFNYFLGLKHINVGIIDPNGATVTPLLRKLDYPVAGAGAGFYVGTALGGAAQSFDEISSEEIRIYNTVPGDIFMVWFGHTAAPATLRKRVTVDNDAENIAVELLGSGDGIVMRSPDGSRHRLVVNNGGNIGTERIS